MEPDGIYRVARAQQNAPKLAKYRAIVESQDDDSFEFRELSGNSALYRKVKSGAQKVLPTSCRFRELVLEELHSSKLEGHMGVRKTMSALTQRVWWPSLIENVKKFVGQY